MGWFLMTATSTFVGRPRHNPDWVDGSPKLLLFDVHLFLFTGSEMHFCFIIERLQISAWNLVLYLWLLQPMPGPLTQQELGRWREQGGEAGLQPALWDSKTKCSGAGRYLLGLESSVIG